MIRVYLDPGRDTASVAVSGWLGERFEAFRLACASAGARFSSAERVSRLPVRDIPALLRGLDSAGLAADVDPALVSILAEEGTRTASARAVASGRLAAFQAALEPGLALLPYQAQGVEWLAARRRGAILGDEMGLGKTIQILASLPADRPVLVVAPACARGVWLAEARKWRPDLRARAVLPSEGFRWPQAGELGVISYGALPPDGGGSPPAETILVADEAHMLKGRSAKRTAAFTAMSKKIRDSRGPVWLATGTPLLNRPTELAQLLKLAGVFEEAFGTWGEFLRLMRGTRTRYGTEWGEPMPEAADRLRRVMLRRRRVEVLPQLPAKTRRDVVVEVGGEVLRLAEEAVAGIRVDDILELPDFRRFSRARAALAAAKVPAMMELVEASEAEGQPLVVMSSHLPPLDELRGREGWGVVTGSTPADERTRLVEEFQAGKLRGIAGSIGALGVSVTLTRACHLVLVSMEWTPGANLQAEDRVCRFGQDRGVLVTRIVADCPLDRRVVELLTEKQKLHDAVVEAASVPEGYMRPAPEEVGAADLARRMTGVAREEATRAAELNREAVLGEVRERDGREVAVHGCRRTAASAREEWAAGALRALAGLDPDRAAELNGVGFNRADGRLGHSLARQLPMLSNKQWECVVRIAQRYPAQVGRFA